MGSLVASRFLGSYNEHPTTKDSTCTARALSLSLFLIFSSVA